MRCESVKKVKESVVVEKYIKNNNVILRLTNLNSIWGTLTRCATGPRSIIDHLTLSPNRLPQFDITFDSFLVGARG